MEERAAEKVGPRDSTPIRRHAGPLAFLGFVGGFLAIWIHGYLTRDYDIPYLSAIAQNQVVQATIQAVSTIYLEAGWSLQAFFRQLYTYGVGEGVQARDPIRRVSRAYWPLTVLANRTS